MNWKELETYANDLAIAAKSLADRCQDAAGASSSATPSGSTSPGPAIPPSAANQIRRAKRNVLAKMAQLQTLLSEPTDVIQHLAVQNQFLSCLRWLGEFQVLAYIPLSGSVPVKDVAELAGVPEMQLLRILRMIATTGFLREPQPGYIAHTPLSAPFVTKLAYFDAVMFLAETAAPAAMHMAVATQRYGYSDKPNECAYTAAFNTSQTFQSACDQHPKTQRQWPAYLLNAGDVEESITELLSQLNWSDLGNSCVVEVGAHSTAAANNLAASHPDLRVVVQLNNSGPTNGNSHHSVDSRQSSSPSPSGLLNSFTNGGTGRITVQKRAPGAQQIVKDAAVYILRLHPSSSPGVPAFSRSSTAHVLSELRAHLAILRGNSSARLVLAPCLLPEPGTVEADVEAMSRLRDLTMMQLANDREMETTELMELVSSVHDNMGRLVVVNKLQSRSSSTVVLEIKYRSYSDGYPQQTIL